MGETTGDINLEQLVAALSQSKAHTLQSVAGLASMNRAAINELADEAFRGTVAVTIPSGGWTVDNNETSSYTRYYDIPAAGVTTHDVAIVTIHRSGIAAAQAAGLCPQNETLTGKIRLRTKTAPASAIAAEYCICPGREE